MARETRSIQGIERDLAEFEAGVSKVAATVAPDLQGGAPEPALSQIVDRLEDHRAAAVKRAQLEKSAEQRRVRRRREQARRQALAPALDAARDHFGVEDDGALGVALERCEARRQQDAERVRLSKQLGEVGDGGSEDELREEQDRIDLALLPDEIGNCQIEARNASRSAWRAPPARCATPRPSMKRWRAAATPPAPRASAWKRAASFSMWRSVGRCARRRQSSQRARSSVTAPPCRIP